MTRTPNDGKPFYCAICGAGWNEYGACERVDCRLESQEDAELRETAHGVSLYERNTPPTRNSQQDN